MAAVPIHYHELKPSRISQALSNIPIKHIERVLLVAAIGCAILSLVPNIGWVGALSLRSVSCTMVATQTLLSIKNDEGQGVYLLHIMRLASVALGLAGVAANMNALVMAGVALNIFLQVVQVGQGSQSKDLYQSLSQASFILIDTLTLISLLTGHWQFAVTAATLNSVVMFTFATKAIVIGVQKRDVNAAMDALCYTALGAVGVASAVRSAEIVSQKTENQHYMITNHERKTLIVTGHGGRQVATIKPGETVRFTLDSKLACGGGLFSGSHVHTDSWYGGTFVPYQTDYVTAITQKPMPVAQLPTSAVVTETPRLKELTPPPTEIGSDALTPFLAPLEAETLSHMVTDDSQSKVTLKNSSTEETTRLDAARSSYFRGVVSLDPREIELDADVYAWFLDFFSHGTSTLLEALTERDLLKLHDHADYLQIERLRGECQREIARRLNEFRWENTALFNRYSGVESELNPLLALFSFQ
ncbi:MAG: hypothetical protein S4CHLAM2_02560 [Chlamydiales bacterium]|nr:hypothetical protein [Chlamydiales bacterium]